MYNYMYIYIYIYIYILDMYVNIIYVRVYPCIIKQKNIFFYHNNYIEFIVFPDVHFLPEGMRQ